MVASVTGGARAGDASTATVAIQPNDAPHGVISFNLSQYVIPEEESNYTARIPIKREFGSLGDLQVVTACTITSLVRTGDPKIFSYIKWERNHKYKS